MSIQSAGCCQQLRHIGRCSDQVGLAGATSTVAKFRASAHPLCRIVTSVNRWAPLAEQIRGPMTRCHRALIVSVMLVLSQTLGGFLLEGSVDVGDGW